MSGMVSRSRGRGRRRWLVAFAVMVGLAVGGSGCATDEGDDPAPTSAPSPTTDAPTEPATDEPTTVPTPWPEPSPPPEMERDDIEGAKAAAVFFIELHQYVYATGDIEKWLEMSHPECQFCSGATTHLTELYGNGGRAEGGKFTVESVTALPPDSDYAHYRVGVSGSEAASVEYSAGGQIGRQMNGGEVDYVVAVLPSAELGWIIRGVAVENDVA
ncbi:DUF6318 family protein [Georgenia sp. MJ173]|uniref:DUF6318 family protein n=1 Tax=Georgenia sunbinii TaxID=3117728 RepID=UPI002F26D4B7